MKIGNVSLNSDLLLAPLAGFSDVGMRKLAVDYGAGLTYTEMVSAKGLIYNNKGTEALLRTAENEKPCAVQLFGSDPEFFYRAAGDERLAKFDIIDINMGCPVKKIFGNGEGSALMREPQLITEIVRAAVEGAGKPVTVKMRAGITEGEPLAVECALAAERGGASAVTVHARYREQLYAGRADHKITREVKRALKIPVIANGDITDADSLAKIREESCADGFMIGRGALGRPYLFAELLNIPYSFDRLSAVKQHVEMLLMTLPDRTVANLMKLHLCHYAKDTSNAKAVRIAAAQTKSCKDILDIAQTYFGQ